MADTETAAVVGVVNFSLGSLSRFDLAQVNALFGNEIEKLQKRCKTKHDCTLCESKDYCEWLHLAQYQALKQMNTVDSGLELS